MLLFSLHKAMELRYTLKEFEYGFLKVEHAKHQFQNDINSVCVDYDHYCGCATNSVFNLFYLAISRSTRTSKRRNVARTRCFAHEAGQANVAVHCTHQPYSTNDPRLIQLKALCKRSLKRFKFYSNQVHEYHWYNVA